jgi:hypothetical protein
MIKDPILAAADLAVVAGHLSDMRRKIAGRPNAYRALTDAEALDLIAIDSAIEALVALAVDCDASISARPYIGHAERAAKAARLFAQDRDAPSA